MSQIGYAPRVIACLRAAGRPLSVAEIATMADLPYSAVRNVVANRIKADVHTHKAIRLVATGAKRRGYYVCDTPAEGGTTAAAQAGGLLP